MLQPDYQPAITLRITLTQPKPTLKWTAVSAFVLLMSYTAYAMTKPAIVEVQRNELSFTTVQSDNLAIYASVFGEFASATERLLTAPDVGTVSEILIRPGAAVKPDSIILRLNNPVIEQRIVAAKSELARQQAQHQALKYQHKNAQLNALGQISETEAAIENAELELKLNLDLSKLGVAANIELQRAKLALKQRKKRLLFEQQKYQQLLEMHNYQQTQADISVEQHSNRVALYQTQLDNMALKAGIAGTLQTLEVKLGQSVHSGQSIARVGSNKDLVAQLSLPQHQADQIDLNAAVLINTNKGIIHGHISRIESLISDGSVLAEAVLDGPLTTNARPALPISAQIFIKHQPNALYIRQLPGMRPNAKHSLLVQTSENLLRRKNITFGALSQDKLVIVDGLTAGARVLGNDSGVYAQLEKLQITD